jgi:hypothetical protein
MITIIPSFNYSLPSHSIPSHESEQDTPRF